MSDALCKVFGSGCMTSVLNFKMAVMVDRQYRFSKLRWDADSAEARYKPQCGKPNQKPVTNQGKVHKRIHGVSRVVSRSLRSTNNGVEVDLPALKPNCTGEIRSSIAALRRV